MMSYNDGLSSCTDEVDEIVNMSKPINSDSETDINNGISIKPVIFSDDLHDLETVKTYLTQQDLNVSIFSFSS